MFGGFFSFSVIPFSLCFPGLREKHRSKQTESQIPLYHGKNEIAFHCVYLHNLFCLEISGTLLENSNWNNFHVDCYLSLIMWERPITDTRPDTRTATTLSRIRLTLL